MQPKINHQNRFQRPSQNEKITATQTNNYSILETLLKPDPRAVDGINQSLLQEQKKTAQEKTTPALIK